MLKQKFSKFKRICTFTYLPRVLRDTKCGKNKIYCNRTFLQFSTKKIKDTYTKDDGGIETFFTKKSDINSETKEDLLNGNIISPAYYQINRCKKCESVIAKLFGTSKPKEDAVDTNNVNKLNAGNLQATTAKIEEEKLTQKIEVIEETSHVEAHPPKIEGFNSIPKVLGQELANFKSKDNNDTSDVNVDEVAKKCLDAPVNEIDKLLINELSNISQKDPFRRLKLDLDENNCPHSYFSQILGKSLQFGAPASPDNQDEESIPLQYKAELIQPLQLDTIPQYSVDDCTKDFKENGFIIGSSIYLAVGYEDIKYDTLNITPYDQQAIPFYEYLNKEHLEDAEAIDEAEALIETIPDNAVENPMAEEKLKKDAVEQQPTEAGLEDIKEDETLNPRPSFNHFNETSLTGSLLNEEILRKNVIYQQSLTDQSGLVDSKDEDKLSPKSSCNQFIESNLKTSLNDEILRTNGRYEQPFTEQAGPADSKDDEIITPRTSDNQLTESSFRSALNEELQRKNEIDQPILMEQIHPNDNETLNPNTSLSHHIEPYFETDLNKASHIHGELTRDHITNILTTYELLTSEKSADQATGDYQTKGYYQGADTPNSAISGTFIKRNLNREDGTPRDTAISAHQNPGEYYTEEFNFTGLKQDDNDLPQLQGDSAVSQSVVFSTMQPRLKLEITHGTQDLEDVKEIGAFKKASGVETDMGEITDVNTDKFIPNTVPLSLLLKRIRERSRIEYCRNVLEKAETEAEFKCPPPEKKSKSCEPSPCARPKRRSNPCKVKTTPCDPCKVKKSGPCEPCKKVEPCDPCKVKSPPSNPCQCPQKKDPCSKLIPFLLNIILKSEGFDKTLSLKPITLKTTTSLNLITEEVVKRLTKMGILLQFKADVLEKEVVFKFARDFEPWIPIPSWPMPKVEKKRPFLCPKHGCKEPTSITRKPEKGKCVPKKNFSVPQFFDSPFFGTI